eukprot:GEZU01011757.1.p1 GENE.GEZU01011757.1~~GEZU01011757.1.p1  ORF type:complete len:310 (+),score=69.50 GEZU01011757.1:76-1005(+)
MNLLPSFDDQYTLTLKAADNLYLVGETQRIIRVKKASQILFKIRPTTPLKKLMARYASMNGLDLDTLIFSFTGPIRPDQTPMDLCMKNNDTITVSLKKQKERIDPQPSTHAEDMLRMLESSEFADVAFMVYDKNDTDRAPTRMPAHRCILSARCEKFRAMFSAQMRESREFEVEINNTTPGAFAAMLQYIYADDISPTTSLTTDTMTAIELLVLSEEYMIPRLKFKCEEAIKEQINVENVAYICCEAERYQAHNLKEYCFDFILANFEEVSASKKFLEDIKQVPDLMLDLIKAMHSSAAASANKKQRFR